MKISKSFINFLLIAIALLTVFSVTKIVRAKQKADRVLSERAEKYTLPFPGILPDHPLYKIKMVRDRLWEFLISDIERKSYFEILMADKRMEAARILIEERNKASLGITTATKAYKYLEKTVPLIKTLREKNFNINNLVDKLEAATLKHESLIDKFLKRTDLTEKERNDTKNLKKIYQDFFSIVLALR